MRYLLLALFLVTAACDSPTEPVDPPGDIRLIRTKGVAPYQGGHLFYFTAGIRWHSEFVCRVDEQTYDIYTFGDPYRCEWRAYDHTVSVTEMDWAHADELLVTRP